MCATNKPNSINLLGEWTQVDENVDDNVVKKESTDEVNKHLCQEL